MINLRLNKIKWQVLSDATLRLEGELATQPILGLVKAEVLLRGVEALELENRGYKEYILVRSLGASCPGTTIRLRDCPYSYQKGALPLPITLPCLRNTRYERLTLFFSQPGLKMWFTHATSRAGVFDPEMRCAVGKKLASPDGEFNIYRRVLAHAPLAKNGDWDGFADGLARDAKAAFAAVDDEARKTTKINYAGTVTSSHFLFIDSEITKCASRVRALKAGESLVTTVLVPWMDPGASPGRDAASDATGETSDEESRADESSDVESMFGKKKKKNKMPRQAPSTSLGVKSLTETAIATTESLEKTLTRLVKKQQELAFPEVDLWNAETKQATGGDAVAAACGVLLAMPPNTTLVVPSDLFASALTFDCQSLGKGRRVLSLAAYAEKEEEKAEAETGTEKSVFLQFDPPSAADDAGLKRAFAAAKKRGGGVALVVLALGAGGACDATEGPEGAKETRAAAEARGRSRSGL